MKLHGSALRLTIFIRDTDLWHHRPHVLPQLDELIGESLVILD
jgi:hypothetical protein